MDGLGGFGNISPLLDLAEDVEFNLSYNLDDPWKCAIGCGVGSVSGYNASFSMASSVASRRPGILVLPEVQVPLSTSYGGYTGEWTISVYGAIGGIRLHNGSSALYGKLEHRIGIDLYNNFTAPRIPIRRDSAPTLILPRTIAWYVPMAHYTHCGQPTVSGWTNLNDGPAGTLQMILDEQMILLTFSSMSAKYDRNAGSDLAETQRFITWKVAPSFKYHAKLIPLTALL